VPGRPISARNAATIAAGDQTAILAFIADVHRVMQFMQGTLPGVAGDTRVSVAGVLGVM
jgi:predicted transporter